VSKIEPLQSASLSSLVCQTKGLINKTKNILHLLEVADQK